MKASDLRKLIGKVVRFKSDRTRSFNYEWVATGIIIDVVRTEVCIGGDWHTNKYVDILEVMEDVE